MISMDLKFRGRVQMHRKFSTEMKRPKKVSIVQTKCLDPKYQLHFFVNEEHLHNLDVKRRLVKITVAQKRLLPVNICFSCKSTQLYLKS